MGMFLVPSFKLWLELVVVGRGGARGRGLRERETVGNLIKHCQGLAEVAWEPVV